jgi:hypothetical protein
VSSKKISINLALCRNSPVSKRNIQASIGIQQNLVRCARGREKKLFFFRERKRKRCMIKKIALKEMPMMMVMVERTTTKLFLLWWTQKVIIIVSWCFLSHLIRVDFNYFTPNVTLKEVLIFLSNIFLKCVHF